MSSEQGGYETEESASGDKQSKAGQTEELTEAHHYDEEEPADDVTTDSSVLASSTRATSSHTDTTVESDQQSVDATSFSSSSNSSDPSSSSISSSISSSSSSDSATTDQQEGEEDPEVAYLQQRASLVQHECERIADLQKQAEEQTGAAFRAVGGVGAAAVAPTLAMQKDIDNRSVYVGQVDYSATASELQAHFQSCGTISRVTIIADKITSFPKGYAYIEFQEESSVANAIALNDTIFRGRQLKVLPKRTNTPNFSRGAAGIARGAIPPFARGRGLPLRGAAAARGFGPWRVSLRARGAPRGAYAYPYYPV